MKALIKKQLFDGKFDIQGEIAKGQTGTILYGYDIGLRQEVAIKIYHSQINGRLIRGKTFVEKSKPLLLLDHPNLIKIFKVEEESDTAVVFMEFFDAPSLKQLIHDKGTLSVQDMLIVAREIAEVLVHTHFQGIIHGTLHPGHVLVGPQGQIKVTDLGLSWVLMEILPDGDEEILRPLPYFPPEIAKEELLNVSSDIYSLGFMMYEMVTGTVPYAELPKTSIMGKLAFDQADPVFDFPSTVPEPVCNLIREMTRNKTEQRLQDATHVLTVISQQLSKLPVSKKSKFLPPEPPQARTQIQEEAIEPQKTSMESGHPAGPEPSIRRAPQIQRPKSSVNYNQGNSTKRLAKVGIILTLIIVVGIAGAVGYWYRDLLEPHIALLQTQIGFPPQNGTLPETIPVEHGIPSVPAQNSLKNQESASAKNEGTHTKTQAFDTGGETLVDSASSAPPLQQRKRQPAAQPTITQAPKVEKPQQKQTLPTIQKQSVSQISRAPESSKPTRVAPTASKSSLQAPTTTINNAPVRKPTIRQPTPTKTRKRTPLTQTQKQPIAKKPLPPRQEKPSASTPIVPKVLSPAPAKSIKKAPLQQSTIQQPTGSKSQQGTTLTPNQKQPISKQPPAPDKPSIITPAASGSTSESSPNTPSKKLLQKSPIQNPPKGTMNPDRASAAPPRVLEDDTREPTNDEMKEILQSLDAAKDDLSSIAAP